MAERWSEVCLYAGLPPERGVAALIGGQQVALFRTHDGEVFAVGNLDPFSGAYVISRGIVGSRGDAPTVASPMYKDVFDLRTGRCLADPAVRLPTFHVRREGERILVGAPPEADHPASGTGYTAQQAGPAAYEADRVASGTGHAGREAAR